MREQKIIEGKTKIITTYDDPHIKYDNIVKIETKDVLTANDGAKQIEADLSYDKTHQTCNVFKFLRQNKIPVSFLRQLSNNAFLAKRTDPIPIEFVIRRKAFGSFLKRHPNQENGERFAVTILEFFHKKSLVTINDKQKLVSEDEARGLYLKDGFWTQPVYTDPLLIWNFDQWRQNGEDYTSKDGFTFDLYPAKEEFSHKTSKKLYSGNSPITVQEFMLISDYMKSIFMLLENKWSGVNIELIDLKVEFGYDYDDRTLVLTDVIDNDSWRIWPAGVQSNQLDKQAYREGEPIHKVIENYKKVSQYTKYFCD